MTTKTCPTNEVLRVAIEAWSNTSYRNLLHSDPHAALGQLGIVTAGTDIPSVFLNPGTADQYKELVFRIIALRQLPETNTSDPQYNDLIEGTFED